MEMMDPTASKRQLRYLCIFRTINEKPPGHQSSPGTKNVDVMTLLGQILHRKGQGLADEYAIAIRPVHLRLVKEAAPALKQMSVKVFLVSDTDIQLLD